MPITSETELYAPVKNYLEQLGYAVRGEVRHCDLVAIRGEEPPIIVELKRGLSIPLLLQAIDRLRISRTVYVAFERPNKGRAPHKASWPELRKLCGMLGLGMMTVQFYKTKKPRVEVECHPPGIGASPPPHGWSILAKPSKYAASKLIQEFQERQADYNVGGSTRRKLVTAYRQKSLHLAFLLARLGPLSPKRLRELTGNIRAAGMLQRNVYLWFQRVGRGVYTLTPEGEQALDAYAFVAESFAEPPLSGPADTAAAETAAAGVKGSAATVSAANQAADAATVLAADHARTVAPDGRPSGRGRQRSFDSDSSDASTSVKPVARKSRRAAKSRP